MKLLELYEHILAYAGVKVNKDGSTDICIAGRSEPAMINGNRLMMPTKEVLHSSDKDIVIFHPFQEYVNRGESDVVRKLRRILNVRLNLAVTAVMDGLLRLLESPADHKHLNHQQREILTAVTAGKLKNVNGESVLRAKLASMITREFPEKPDSLCVNLFMKKSGTFNGVKHQRVGVVSFGFYEALERNATHFNKEQLLTLKQLFEFMFPDSEDASTEAWNGFSDSAECPWLDCLLKTSYNVVSRLREIANLYADFMTSPETGDIPDEIVFDVEWLDEVDNLKAYKQEILLIPSQAGNEGAVETAKQSPPAAQNQLAGAALSAANAQLTAAIPNGTITTTVQQVQQPPQTIVQQPMMQPMMQPMPAQAPAHKLTSDGRIDLSGPGGFQQPAMMVQGSGVTSPIQQQMMMSQMQQQMMQNPGLMAAYANNGLMPMQMMQPQMPMQQMMPMQPMQGYYNQVPMQQMMPAQQMPSLLNSMQMNQPLYQPAGYGVPGIQVNQPSGGIGNIRNV